MNPFQQKPLCAITSWVGMRHLVSLATLALTLVTLGATAVHAHATDAPDAVRVCTVCHVGQNPVAPTQGPTLLPAWAPTLFEVVPLTPAANSADPTSLHRSRAPPSV